MTISRTESAVKQKSAGLRLYAVLSEAERTEFAGAFLAVHGRDFPNPEAVTADEWAATIRHFDPDDIYSGLLDAEPAEPAAKMPAEPVADRLPNSDDRLQAALGYVAQGYRIIPCVAGGKVPLVKDWHGNALTTGDQVRATFNEYGDINLALCPADMGWGVVDIDDGANVTELELPETYTVATPSGGRHLYYDCTGTDPLRPTVGRLAQHVDTRGADSYVLIVPSVFCGAAYRVTDARKPVPLPASIVARMAKPADKAAAAADVKLDEPGNVASARALLVDYARRGNVAVSGSGGNNFTYKIACKLVRDYGLTGATAHQLMLEHWNDACVPPWSPGELAIIVNNSLSYGQNEQGAYATKPAAETFAGADLSKYVTTPETATAKQEQAKPFLMTLADLFNQPDPEPLIEELLMRGDNASLYGPPKLGKSFMALEQGLCVATGKPVLGKYKVLHRGPVVYLTGEGKRGFKKRIAAWAQEHGITDINQFLRSTPFFFKAAVPLTANGAEEAGKWAADIVNQLGRRPALLIVDTKAKSMRGLNENDNSHAEQFLSMMEDFIELLDCTTLTIAHAGKDADKGQRGASAATAGFDAVWRLDGDKETGALRLFAEDVKDDATGRTMLVQRYDVVLPDGQRSQAVRLATETDQKRSKKGEERNADLHRAAIRNLLHQHEAYSPAKGIDKDRLAELMAGKPPAADASKDDKLRYATQLAMWKTAIREGTKRRSPGKGRPRSPAAFAGLFSEEDFHSAGDLVPVFWVTPSQLDLNGAAYAARTDTATQH